MQKINFVIIFFS